MATVAHIHWLGKKLIAADTSSSFLKPIWDLKETVALESYVLDRFSLVPWRVLPGNTNPAATNPASALLRPLLDDALQQEWWIEMRSLGAPASSPAGTGSEAIFAIKLDDSRAKLWQKNLASVLESLTGGHAVQSSDSARPWKLAYAAKNSNTSALQPSKLFEFARSGDWTILSFAASHNSLMDNVLANISRSRAPFPAPATKFWFEANLDLSHLTDVFPLRELMNDLTVQLFGLPKVALTINGSGSNVFTHADLDFPKPLPFKVEPWNIPTNLIHGPLLSFMAMQGVKPWMGGRGAWRRLQLGDAPNQLFAWAQPAMPTAVYFAAPLGDASNKVEQITQRLIKDFNPWLQETRNGRIDYSQYGDGLIWNDSTYNILPFLQWAPSPLGTFIAGGMVRSAATNSPMAPVLDQIRARTNLVFFEGEATGQSLRHWVYTGQLLRLIFLRQQMPHQPFFAWCNAAERLLRDSSTQVAVEGSHHLELKRNSPIGMTAVEFHLLADWFESPIFPYGSHTFSTPEEPKLPSLRPPGVPAHPKSP